jgi:hypothetical protein
MKEKTKKNWLDFEFGVYALFYLSGVILVVTIFINLIMTTNNKHVVKELTHQNDSLKNKINKLDSTVIFYPTK